VCQFFFGGLQRNLKHNCVLNSSEAPQKRTGTL
jgi:hypothetical protein